MILILGNEKRSKQNAREAEERQDLRNEGERDERIENRRGQPGYEKEGRLRNKHQRKQNGKRGRREKIKVQKDKQTERNNNSWRGSSTRDQKTGVKVFKLSKRT